MSESKIAMKVEQEIKPLKELCEKMVSLTDAQLAKGAKCIDANELGEVIDMIKDLAEAKKETVEACYKMQIMEAMEEAKGSDTYYYSVPYEDYDRGRMYYGGGQGNGNYGQGSGGTQTNYYTPRNRMDSTYYTPDMYRERPWGMDLEYMQYDPRESRTKQSRRMYMESKELYKDQGAQMKELEKYIQDLGEDITEMITNATPEEKQLLQQKIATLSAKIR